MTTFILFMMLSTESLGNPSFRIRESAHATLTKMPAATPFLHLAMKHRDLEIRIRAERLVQGRAWQEYQRRFGSIKLVWVECRGHVEVEFTHAFCSEVFPEFVHEIRKTLLAYNAGTVLVYDGEKMIGLEQFHYDWSPANIRAMVNKHKAKKPR